MKMNSAARTTPTRMNVATTALGLENRLLSSSSTIERFATGFRLPAADCLP